MKRNGLERISDAFESSKEGHKAALMPYYTLGYPNLKTAIDIIKAIAPYCHLLELGVPFSDPIADGPTIQRSTQIALEQDMTSAKCLEAVRLLRSDGIDVPILLMGYYNPILAYGERQYVQDAAEAGADGFIIPDLPPEESNNLESYANQENLALIHFLAPTSNPERISRVLERASGFVYMVSVTGVTGARSKMDDELENMVRRVKAATPMPVAVGFGIGSPGQAAATAEFADGVIVGSALINSLDENALDKTKAPVEFVKSLWDALRRTPQSD